MKQLYDTLIKEKGFTVDKELNQIDKKGYFVSINGIQRTVPLEYLTLELFEEIVRDYQEQEKIYYIGAWISDNIVYFDNTILVEDIATAINLALDNNQIAIYDNTEHQSIYIFTSLDFENKYEITV